MKEKKTNISVRFLQHNTVKILAATRDFLSEHHLIIAVSGGPDSTCLLHVLASIHPKDRLTAVYVHHNLRPEEAQTEIHFLHKLCIQLGISFQSVFADTPAYIKEHKLSVEDGARQLRYSALEKERIKNKAQFILTAHTADDQVEEFFIRTIRGCGISGLAGMQTLSNKILRPFLNETKKTLLAYLERNKLSYCIDSSNSDPALLRNKVRNELLPTLVDEFNPSISQTVLQISNVLQAENDFMERQASLLFPKAVEHGQDVLCINNLTFTSYHRALQRRIAEKAIWKMHCRPTFRTIENLLKLIETSPNNNELHLGTGLRAVKQKAQTMLFYPYGKRAHRNGVSKTQIEDFVIPCPGTYHIKNTDLSITVEASNLSTANTKKHIGKVISADHDKVSFPLTVRSHKPGERFTPLGFHGSKKISRFLNEKKISKDLRYQYPIVTSENTIMCVAGLQVSEQYKCEKSTINYLHIFLTVI